MEESPRFSQETVDETFVGVEAQRLHVALIVVKSPHLLDDYTLEGIGLTLSQLSKLGLSCVVVVDPQNELPATVPTKDKSEWRFRIVEQAERIVAAIDRHGGSGARCLDAIVGISPLKDGISSSVKVRGCTQIVHPNLLLKPLRRGIIPVVAPIGYTSVGQTMVPVAANEVVLALTRELAGLVRIPASEMDTTAILSQRYEEDRADISLDRIIVLDPDGGIPVLDGNNRSHIFINLEQEYEDIRNDLLRGSSARNMAHNYAIANNNHLDSLQLARDALAILPSSSSALLTTPQEAASSAYSSPSVSMPGVGTRSTRNPLIHNLLTDKPILSSSLPHARLQQPSTQDDRALLCASPPTFIKRGMPLTIIPDPRVTPWRPPNLDDPPLQLSDPRIDLPRLIHLIEDSFGRPLNAQHYLSRVKSSLAGIIIAGSYEGAAILTWEAPPDLDPSILPSTPEYARRMVPYLDKFAVLRRSQGAGGVADIVFSSMVRDAFPEGVVWRSRRDNPVNKWYFERARGTWKFPVAYEGAQAWTMFWTTEGVSAERFSDYEGVCRSVGTSWADGKNKLD